MDTENQKIYHAPNELGINPPDDIQSGPVEGMEKGRT